MQRENGAVLPIDAEAVADARVVTAMVVA